MNRHIQNPNTYLGKTLSQNAQARTRTHAVAPPQHQRERKRMETARTVKDVSPHEFVKAYAAHLKRSGKVDFHTSPSNLTF